jgi:hypothetical protein
LVRHHLKKLAIAGSAFALLFSTVGADAASALAPIAGVGHPGSCAFLGKASIKPALIAGGTTTPVKTKVSGSLGKVTPCSGGSGDGAGVVAGSVKGLITSTGTNDCLALATVGLPAFSISVKWKTSKTSPKLDPTTIDVAPTPPGAINLAGPNGSIQITLSGTGAATDAKGKPQSFVGNTFSMVATTDQTLAAFTTACSPPSKGLKGFSFTGLNGPSTFTG